MTPAKEHRKFLLKSASYSSFGLAIFLVMIKFFAWIKTDAVSLQASLVDSLVDAVASFINVTAIHHALKPADLEHRFGHGKIEAIAAQGQSIFIGGTALLVFFDAIHRLIHPLPVYDANLGLWVVGFTILSTITLVLFQLHVVKITRSPVIKADSLHFKADLLLNISVAVALIASGKFGLLYIDSLCGIGIAAYILYTTWQIGKEAFNILVDRELPDQDREKIEQIVLSHKQVKGMHDLKTRSAGPHHFIQLHLELDGNLTLNQAHHISLTVVNALKKEFPDTDVLIHEDPFDDRALE
jgi:ferrous-iron efflux pump FieF